MRLYHVPHTRSTRVLWLLEEIGAPYEITVMAREDRHEAAHLARHPLGRVPVIEDEGGYQFESSANVLHLADLHPDAGLIGPLGSRERALAYQWCFFAMTELESEVLEYYYFKESDAARAAKGLEAFRVNVAPVEELLGRSDCVLGERFSAADVVMCGVLGFARSVGMTEGLANVNAYVDRMDARPARQRSNAVK